MKAWPQRKTTAGKEKRICLPVDVGIQTSLIKKIAAKPASARIRFIAAAKPAQCHPTRP
jgi:hypothetical protein